MSVGNSAGISFGGLSSGIDTESIITKLMQLEQRGLQRIQSRQGAVKDKIDLYGQLKTQVQNLRTATGTLNNATNFSGVKATSSTTDTASITGTTGANAGIYNLSVYQLAKAQKLSSNPQADLTTALGQSGTINLNGKDVTIAAGDNLSQIAEKINNASTGVTASVINGGSGNTFLTLTAKDPGATNNVRLKDTSGTVLSSLGFTATAVRSPITNGAASYGASSASVALNKISTFTSSGATSVTINGQSLSIDPSNDTLTTLAAKIN
ncbi:MAG: hypothetical protein EBU88_20355, partial [Acidobacteria bacterium]|nr:hypothetical protein [Acidobacteriota bacterium]